MKKIVIAFWITLLFLSAFSHAEARSVYEIDDWYIKDFKTDIVVHADTSVTITEWILADCGDLYNKHGIFRTVPTFYQETFFRRIQTPVMLASITDFSGQPHMFEVISHADSVTWKIGDPDVTVQYEQEYKIVYRIENAVRTRDSQKDEFYWNLNGNFWDIETDVFTATVHLPNGVSQANSQLDYYYGQFGEKRKENAQITWLDPQTIQVHTERTMLVGEGITLSVAFPKNIILALPVSWWNQYQQWTIYLLPILLFFACWFVWRKYGRDVNLHKAIVPEYGPPEGFDVLQLAMIWKNASFNNSFISAALMNLATRKVIQITSIVLDHKDKMTDCTFVFLDEQAPLTKPEQALIEAVWGEPKPSLGAQVNLSSLKDKFYKKIPDIIKATKDELAKKNVFTKKGISLRYYMSLYFFIALFAVIGLTYMGVIVALEHTFVICASLLLVLVFAQFMPKLTAKGYEVFRHMQGFQSFVNSAETHRQVFFEKQHIFESVLPYAIIFGVVKEWVKAVHVIYGEKAVEQTSVYWGTGTAFGSMGNIDTFASSLASFSSNMTSTMTSNPSSSGSSGGGSSGGGGGGGGGGGW